MTPVFSSAGFARVVAALAAPLPEFDARAAASARARQAQLTKPPGALGKLEDLAVFMAGWQGQAVPTVNVPQVLVFAGNHGVCARGVNVYPQAVTAQMVRNFDRGGAAINQLAALAGARVDVVPLHLDRPTADICTSDAMDESETLDALAAGYAAVSPGCDVLVLGEMGIGNSTIAAALAAALFGGGGKSWVGPGTATDDQGLARKIKAVDLAIERVSKAGLDLHAPDGAFWLLATIGGREQAAIVGAIIAARQKRIPVLLDGFIVTASAAVLARAGDRMSSSVNLLAHCLAGHVGAEPGHRPLLSKLGLSPLLDLGMRLGEGSGAAVALLVVKAALSAHSGMATFSEAGVSEAGVSEAGVSEV